MNSSGGQFSDLLTPHPHSLENLIARCHEQLGQLFFMHQEAVLVGDLPNAVESLRLFTTAHELHKNFEDEFLLPRLAELDDPGEWPVSLYHQEHDRIEDLLSQLAKDLDQLSSRQPVGSPLRAALIELLDQEKTFKGLCEHHQAREEKGMLPALDRQTEPAWRQKIIEPFDHEWRAMYRFDSR